MNSSSMSKTIRDIRIRESSDLCKIAELLGYKDTGRFAINQLQCENGAFVSSLLRFLDDNPGCMKAIQDWILNKYFDDDNSEEDLSED